MTLPSDEDLLINIQNQDEAALELLLARYKSGLERHLVNLVRDREAALDLYQELTIRLWNRAEQWDKRGTIKAWLFRIASNLALNHLRSVKRRRQQPLLSRPDTGREEEETAEETPAWLIDGSALGPPELAEQAETYQLLRALVAALPQEKREVVELAYDWELETPKIAERLGIPVGTVKSRLHYAGKRLARAWKELEREWED